jgi:hypothetical protein
MGTIFSKTIGQLVSTYPDDDPGKHFFHILDKEKSNKN